MFDTVPGQTAVKDFFARAMRDDALGHAYLFCGREGLGKAAFALDLAVALVSDCDGCGACPACDRARRGLHPDLHILEREGESIRREQVDPLIADLGLKPFLSSRRVWIIAEVEHLTPEAANKLLKSIEEPPADVYFFLVTDHLEQVVPTIVSRCQLVEFRPLSDEQVGGYVRERYGLEGLEAEALARLAGGSVERAARLADDALGAGLRDEYLRYVAGVVQGAGGDGEAARGFVSVLERQTAEIAEEVQGVLARRLAELADQFQDPRDLKWHQRRVEAQAKREEARRRRVAALDALDLLTSWLRDLWVVACGSPDVLWNCDHADELAGAAVATPEHYARLLARTARTRKDLRLNIDQKLALLALFARFEREDEDRA